MNQEPIRLPDDSHRPTISDQELELLAQTGIARDDVVQALGESKTEQGIPEQGTPEYAAWRERVQAMRTPEEIAELQAHDDAVIDNLENQFK